MEYFWVTILLSFHLIIFNIFLFRASLKNQRDYPLFSNLKITSIINFILAAILLFIPSVSISTPYSEIEERIFIGIVVFRSLIFNITLAFTMGVIIFLIGYKYKSQLGPYLMYSGISWMIYFIYASILLNGFDPSIPGITSLLVFTGVIEACQYLILNSLLGIGVVFGMFGVIFLLVHAFSHKDKNLILVGVTYLISAFLVNLGSIPSYLRFC